MARNIKERIEMLKEFDDVIDNLNRGIETYEKWAYESDTSEEVVNSYLNTATIKTRVRDMIIKLAESV